MRLLYLGGSLIYLGYGFLSQVFLLIVDPFLIRVVITTPIIFTFVLSYFYPNKITRNIYVLHQIFLQLMNLNIIYILYLNNFDLISVVYFFVYLGIITLILPYTFKHSRDYIIYFTLLILEISTLLIYINNPEFSISYFVFLGSIYLLIILISSFNTLHFKNYLIRKKSNFDFILNNSELIFFIINKEGIFEISLGAGLEDLGLEQGEVVGKSVFDVYDQNDEIKNVISEALSGKTLRKQVNIGDLIYEVFMTPKLNDDGKVEKIIGISLNVTEQIQSMKKLQEKEEQIAQIQKLELIGELSSGIAHDFNNLLSVITLDADILLNLIESHKYDINTDEITNLINEIKNSATQGSYLSNRMLSVTNQDIRQPEIIEINSFLNDQKSVFNRVLTSNIELKILTQKEDIFVKINKTQLMQILLNLILNSKDAIEDNGLITISIESDTNHKIVDIIVEDNGSGIKLENLSKIFNPFFTTKSKGTGLGLYNVKNILQDLGGDIRVNSQYPEGCKFTISLPQMTKFDEIYGTNSDSISELRIDEDLTILLVEDNEELRFSISKLLQNNFSIKCYTAANGKEAYKIFKNNEDKIDIVLTDIRLPKMDGLELTFNILKDSPNAKIILMSGFTNLIDPKLKEMENITFISKPFTINKLGTKIKSLI